ncbi:MAG: hypothetical protein AAGD17_07450 [Bacteroidota bacterium]
MIQRHCFTKPLQFFVLLFSIIALTSACSDKEKDKDLVQAFKSHEEAIEVRRTVADQIGKLKANTDSLFVITYSKELKSISSALEEWDEQLVEVPGFEEEHDHSHHDHSGHDHDHHHDHNHSKQELTPKQHLEIQQHLLQKIKGLAQKISNIKE